MDARAEPAEFLRARADALGAVGLDWLAALPETIRSLESDWHVTVGEPLPGGSAAHVLDARTDAGERVVLKLGLPGEGFRREIAALELADGNGYVRALRSDPVRSALLLEPLGGALNGSGLAPERQLDILGRLIAGGWDREHPRTDTFERLDKAAELGAAIAGFRETLDHGCADAVFDACARHAAARSAAYDPRTSVVVHGDAAAANVLQVLSPRAGAELGWVLVDPDPFLGDREYDLGVAARDWNDELLASDDPGALIRRYCETLARASGADPRGIDEWAFLERVSTGLFVLSFGARDYARPFFESAERILETA